MALAITNVRIFDGVAVIGANTVRIDGSRVVEVGDAGLLRPDDERVDGAGGTLLPGLIDAHVHLLPGSAVQALGFGVTTLLDMFSKPPLPDRENAARARGATVLSSSVGATATGGHPSMMYAPFPTVDSPAQAEDFVRARVGEGARHLKVFYESGQSIDWPMPSLSLDTVRALVAAAHEQGLLVVAHAPRGDDAVAVVEAGVDVLAHVPFDPLRADQVATIAEHGVATIATLSIADGFPPPDATMPLLGHPGIAGRLGPRWTATVRAQGERWMPPGVPSFESDSANVRALHASGATVLAGTDAPNPGTVHGASLHRELWHLVRAGLSPVAALRAATSAVADTFGLDGLGVLRPGALADLVLVRGRPDVEITDSTSIVAVWKHGGPADLVRYVGSPEETAGLDYLAEQTARVIEAVTAAMPSAVDVATTMERP